MLRDVIMLKVRSYTHTCTYTNAHTQTRTHTHTQTCFFPTNSHINTHGHTHTHPNTLSHTHTHTRLRISVVGVWPQLCVFLSTKHVFCNITPRIPIAGDSCRGRGRGPRQPIETSLRDVMASCWPVIGSLKTSWSGGGMAWVFTALWKTSKF